MQRRTFILGGTALIAAGSLGLYTGKNLQHYDLAALLQQLQAFRGKEINHSGVWSAS